jgi:hypothetical protein
MEQSTSTELDKARERFVEAQMMRIRQGQGKGKNGFFFFFFFFFLFFVVDILNSKEPLLPPPESSRFVSSGFSLPASQSVGSSKMVPEIDIPELEKKQQFEETKRLMEEKQRLDEQNNAAESEKKERRVIHNYNKNFQRH